MKLPTWLHSTKSKVVAIGVAAIMFGLGGGGISVWVGGGEPPPNVGYPLSGTPICGQSVLNSPYNSGNHPALGTTTSVVVLSPGNISADTLNTNNTTYYFQSGSYNLGTGQFSQIQMGDNDWYVGEYSAGVGATLTGQNDNATAFSKPEDTSPDFIEYMTVENFNPAGAGAAIGGADGVGGDISGASPDLTVAYSTVENNYPGSGVILGTNSTIKDNCLINNGDYGAFSYCFDSSGGTYCQNSAVTNGPQDISVLNNEIAYDDQCNYENVPTAYFPITEATQCSSETNKATVYQGCGCAGGMKFWATDGAKVVGDYVHDNYDVGLWWDTNDNAEYIDDSYFSNNYTEAVDIEISYNALITDNNFVNNAWGAGGCGPAANNACYSSGNLAPAIYDSESGGSGGNLGNAAWPTGSPIGTFTISGNNFSNNWDAIMSYDNPDRFAGSPYNTSTGFGTLGLPTSSFTSECTGVDCTPSGSGPNPTTTYWANCSGGSPGTPSCPTTPVAGGCGYSSLHAAVPGGSPDYWNNCWWKISALNVSGNQFAFNSTGMCGDGTTGSTICCTTSSVSYCGMNAVWQQAGSLAWSPYLNFDGGYGMWAQMDNCNASYTYSGCTSLDNSYSNNTYTHGGSQAWRFFFYNGVVQTPTQWQSDGWDSGSTFS